MKQHLVYLSFITFFFSIIQSHGFDENILISHGESYRPIADFTTKRKHHSVTSYDVQTQTDHCSNVVRVGKSKTNCFCTIACKTTYLENIACTPTQQFFDTSIANWVFAFQLRAGDIIRTRDGTCTIDSVTFENNPLSVCALEVEDTHTFYVGRQRILTHNMFLPALSLGLGVSFGSGAAAGGTAGSFFGPFTFIGGATIGGIIGCTAYLCSRNRVAHYQLHFDAERVGNYIQRNEHEAPKPTGSKGGETPIPPASPPDPEDDSEQEGSENTKTVEDLIRESRPKTKQTNGKANQREKIGQYKHALKDFKSLNPQNIRDVSTAKDGSKLLGTLKDGTTAMVRSTSSIGKDYSGGPTLEIKISNTNVLKFRYL